MSKKIPSYSEMVARPVIRPNLPLEWLTKVTLSEYNRWAESEMECVSMAGMSMHLRLKNLENQRNASEKLYQMTKERNGLKKDADIKLGGRLTGDQTIIYDLVGIPSTRNAVLRADKYEPDPLHVVMDEIKETLNGRSYPKNWMTGGYDYVPSKRAKNNYLY